MKIEIGNFESLDNTLKDIKKDDMLTVPSLDFFAQNLKELEEKIQKTLNAGASIYFEKEDLLFSEENEFLLKILHSFKIFEQENIIKRRRLGIQKAKAEGKYSKERRKKLSQDLQEILLKERENGLKVSDIIKKYKISRKTFYNYAQNSTNNILKDIGILLNNDLNEQKKVF